ncbi:MAG: FkbM family methyltransferase [Kovacikia sp.]
MFHELLSTLSIFDEKNLVLVDVGASGDPAPIWQELAPFSVYIGFDPDLRELKENRSSDFKRFILVNKAITDNDSSKVKFFLTSSPYCSSLLKPNLDNCKRYGFTELFEIETCVELPATSLNQVIQDLQIHGIDWLKLDSQGKDLDIFLSIDQTVRNHLLAVDIEPGFIPFYEGENTFDEAHKALLEEGFWLANLSVQNFPRIMQSTRNRLSGKVGQFQNKQPINFDLLPGSPTAIEARYLRTIEHLQSVNSDLRQYVSLWMFALLDGKTGFALDIALHLMNDRETEQVGQLLLDKTINLATGLQKFQAPASQAFLDGLNLREINLIVFPDWQQLESQIYDSLAAIIRILLMRPDGQRLNLLISTANGSATLLQDLNEVIGNIILQLLMANEGGIDPVHAPEITLLQALSPPEWQVLLPHIKARLRLEQEDHSTLAQVPCDRLLNLTLDQLLTQTDFS